MKHGGKIGMKVTMQGRQIEEVNHMRVCVTKGKKVNGSPKKTLGMDGKSSRQLMY